MLVASAPAWKHFPRFMALAMGAVIAVNARFIYVAIATFPGAATQNDFETSNRYNAVLEAQAKQDALNWHETIAAEGRRLVITLTDRDHAPLTATLSARAIRPVGTVLPVALHLRAAGAGRYEATENLPAPGQWDIALTVTAGADMAHVTRRVVVR